MDRTEKSREPEGFRFLLCPFFPEAAEGCSAGARHFGRRMFPPDAAKREIRTDPRRGGGDSPTGRDKKGENGRKMEDRITGEAKMGSSGRFCGVQGKKSGESGGEVED